MIFKKGGCRKFGTKYGFWYLLLVILIFDGCAITWNGHYVNIEDLSKFQIGKTTKEEVEKNLGEPEDILNKPYEKITIYVYKSTVNTFVGLPIPGFTIGRAKQTGFLLHIIFKDGVYTGYDFTQMKQRLLF
ncbi:MAG: hypothetical protein A2X87_00940 [Deltaproteobacteria bacterium GWC2_42_51]|nr:MAG: hypothetical protein A2056_03955 [Deltaproteobacteria bacterium GWA2_42_85]OGP31565.1 MAG: hypothetical protein A2067_01320 [Deltaproteobacteria bacterium GWB2_42_7]OGP33051.1 MAG: hypothetical protein A2X87_00940 [Deltaproteobacteria bacterium GWC2_42_51]OGP42134.1 MAG: hypothetical protein A2090_02430 [Deltaproteobacteria bacterium GWD2_42_10]OGP48539.1 MAG: hypothetical protein A2022_08905 [Deltaproteobacteria bacterium GWF2_42_12]OGQ29344.1 MAG: hypothetical protein A3D29_03035 [De